MGVVLIPGGRDIQDLLQQLLEGYYPELVECQLRVAVELASLPDRPPLKQVGAPVPGTIKIVPYQYRVLGVADVLITLDAAQWADYDEPQRLAALDYQLIRLAVRRDKEGAIRSDDQGRPLLKLNPPDRLISIYDTIIRRHGAAAPATRELQEASQTCQQLLRPAGEPGCHYNTQEVHGEALAVAVTSDTVTIAGVLEHGPVVPGSVAVQLLDGQGAVLLAAHFDEEGWLVLDQPVAGTLESASRFERESGVVRIGWCDVTLPGSATARCYYEYELRAQVA